jgi:hypothetical protein
MSLECSFNGDLCLLLNRLIEGEASKEDFVEIEMLFRTDPAVLDAYFDLLETDAMLHWSLGAPAVQTERQHRYCSLLGRAGLGAETAVTSVVPPESVPTRRVSAMTASPQCEAALPAAPALAAYDALLSQFLQNRIKLLVPGRTVT